MYCPSLYGQHKSPHIENIKFQAEWRSVSAACRRLFACGAGTFGAGSPTFRKTRSTSPESGMLCFPSTGTSYHIMCSRNKTFELSWTSLHHLSTATINSEHITSIASSTHKKLFEKEEKRFRGRSLHFYFLQVLLFELRFVFPCSLWPYYIRFSEENEGMNAHIFRRKNWMLHFKKDVQKMF